MSSVKHHALYVGRTVTLSMGTDYGAAHAQAVAQLTLRVVGALQKKLALHLMAVIRKLRMVIRLAASSYSQSCWTL